VRKCTCTSFLRKKSARFQRLLQSEALALGDVAAAVAAVTGAEPVALAAGVGAAVAATLAYFA
jgi:hypothetical protein